MALVLVKEDGTGVDDANTYAALADATSYHEGHIDGAAWVALGEAKQNICLVQATRLLDACCRWYGAPDAPAQFLGWPRSGQNAVGLRFGIGTVPPAVIQATCELARVIGVSGDPAVPSAASAGKVSRVQVGPLSVSLDPGSQTTSVRADQILPPQVYILVRSWVQSGYGTVTIQRVS